MHAKSKETFKALSKPSSSRPPQIHTNHQPRQIPTGQGYRPSMSSISNNPAISLHNHIDLANHYDDFVVTDGVGREHELQDRLEHISGLNLLDSAIHSDCVVTSSLILQDGSKIDARTLFDTGCSVGTNFMSKGHFDLYPVLTKYLVKHPTNTIDLATHGSTAVVSQYISVVLEIVHRGRPIRCKILIGIMQGLRYDLVLGLAVIASHYTEVLMDLLSFQLKNSPSQKSNSMSMMAAHHAEQAIEFADIPPAVRHNWRTDYRNHQLYVTRPDLRDMQFFAHAFPNHYYNFWTPDNAALTNVVISAILHDPEFQAILQGVEARAVLKSLQDEAKHPQLPLFTDDEARIVWTTIAPHNPTISKVMMRQHFPDAKLRPLTNDDLRRLLHHRFWHYRRGSHASQIDQPNHEYDDRVDELRIFVMFVYHKYIDPAHYRTSQVLGGALSLELNDILRKLHAEACNLLKMEIFGREHLIPGLTIPISPSMDRQLFIMVCRHFAYGGTMNHVIPLKKEFEDLLADRHVDNQDLELYDRLQGLLTPFRLSSLPHSNHYDPNCLPSLTEDIHGSYVTRCANMHQWMTEVRLCAHKTFNRRRRFVRLPEPLLTSFALEEIYSFAMFIENNYGPLLPFTFKNLRTLLRNSGIVHVLQLHEDASDDKQFLFAELSGILYLLYTNILSPEFFRGEMLPYAVTQQLSHLVLNHTFYYLFLAVHHVYTKAPHRSAHYLVWAKVNIARFQRFAISTIAFAVPDLNSFLGHTLNVYYYDCTNDVFPDFTTPRQNLDSEVLLGRARCKVF